ncbi:DUF4382 domain-containing protein [Ectothiorhodospiraceae bacterium 2226]|nr:DUF4382 domain-containing protein [Ectothiorhodospiraceae bacterium 2226]
MKTKAWVTGGAVAVLLAGCGGGSDGGPSTGHLTLAITDAPVDEASAVVVAFTGVSLKPASGPALAYHFCAEDEEVVARREACDEPVVRQIDLLALQGEARETLLDGVELPAGRYNWVRLHVLADGDADDSYLEDTLGGRHPLYVPSGDQTGLKLVSGFVVPAGGQADFTIDFDLRKSIHRPAAAGQGYRLRPALRLIDTAESGTLAGEVDADLMLDEACTGGDAVYVFAGHDAEVQDVRGDAGDPLMSARVSMDEDSGAFGYRAAYLAPGDYTAAFTCQGTDDDPETADAIEFRAVANATVTAGAVTVLDLP